MRYRDERSNIGNRSGRRLILPVISPMEKPRCGVGGRNMICKNGGRDMNYRGITSLSRCMGQRGTGHAGMHRVSCYLVAIFLLCDLKTCSYQDGPYKFDRQGYDNLRTSVEVMKRSI